MPINDLVAVNVLSGGQVVLWDRVFVSASFEYFKKSGERVIVHEGEVFPCGYLPAIAGGHGTDMTAG